MTGERTTRYRDDDVVYCGVTGENLEILSANPRNYHAAISAPEACEPVTIDAKLFVPALDAPLPTVIIVPGSLGVGPNHEMHAETLLAEGFAVCVVDPFGSRSVVSTVANQTYYSFAASAFDVLATVRALRDRPEIDADRIAAQGHSRGGSAVLTAACRRFADPILGEGIGLAAVYAAYPWCGHQFLDPSVGNTRVRAIIGDQDDWCSVQQMQSLIHAMQLSGADATSHIVAGAAHSFDRMEPVTLIAEARVAPAAPIVMLDDNGAMIDPYTDVPDHNRTDYDAFVTAAKAGFARLGAHIGGTGDQPERFRDDMCTFHSRGRRPAAQLPSTGD